MIAVWMPENEMITHWPNVCAYVVCTEIPRHPHMLSGTMSDFVGTSIRISRFNHCSTILLLTNGHKNFFLIFQRIRQSPPRSCEKGPRLNYSSCHLTNVQFSFPILNINIPQTTMPLREVWGIIFVCNVARSLVLTLRWVVDVRCQNCSTTDVRYRLSHQQMWGKR